MNQSVSRQAKQQAPGTGLVGTSIRYRRLPENNQQYAQRPWEKARVPVESQDDSSLSDGAEGCAMWAREIWYQS